ncbi:MAG TPA: MmcQ/YjbR family DNA-binding protein [Puia sp.]|nr:MmcQ/YjbR family DNA-binding protein [Puia sp.]
MVNTQLVRQMALSFPETDEHPHFERQAFRVKKKIFATLLEKNQTLNVKLSRIDQSVFCAFDPAVIYPVPGKWGLNGMTTIELKKIKKSMLKDALTCAYCRIAPPEFAQKYLR